MKKRHHHYVPRYYLRQWLSDDKIYCLRDGVIRYGSLESVGMEKDFYGVQFLSQDEANLISNAFIEPSARVLQPYLRYLLFQFTQIGKLKQAAEESRIDMKHKPFIDLAVSNLGEEYHSIVEKNFYPFIDQMLEGNTDFYGDPERLALFLGGLALQFTRTKQVREASAAVIGESFHGCNTRKVIGVLSYLMSLNIAHGLFLDQASFKICMVPNRSINTPLITADQPVINVHATSDRRPPTKLEFYYPLSPMMAMRFLEIGSSDPEPLDDISANAFNMLMVQNSYEQVYSNSRQYLESIRPLVQEVRRKG